MMISIQTQWSVSLYLLAFVSLIITSGRFGDLIGRRSTLIVGLIIFTFGSLLGGLAHNAIEILLGRVLQGFGSAIMWPNTTALVFTSAGENKKAFAMGVLMGVAGLAMSFGPPLAGFLSTVLNWRWFFLFNVPIGLAILIYISFFVDIPNKKTEGSIDYKGLIVLTTAIILLVFGINEFAKNVVLFLIMLSMAAVLIYIFYRIEVKIKHPLIDISLFKNSYFVLGCSIRWLVNFSYYILLFIMGLYLHTVLKYTTFQAGALLLPMTILIGLISPFGGKLIDQIGAKKPVMICLILFFISYLSFIILNICHTTLLILALFILPGICFGVISSGLMVIAMRSVPEEKAGVASGIFYMMSVFGSLVGVTLSGLILTLCKHATLQATLFSGFPWIMITCALAIMLGGVLLTFVKS